MEITDPILIGIIQQGVSLEKAIKIRESLPANYAPPSALEMAKRSFRELTAEARPLALASLINMLNDPETTERLKLDAARVILVDIAKAELNLTQQETIEESEVEKRLKRASQVLKNNIVRAPELALISTGSADASADASLEKEKDEIDIALQEAEQRIKQAKRA